MTDRHVGESQSWRAWVLIGFVYLLWWNFALRRLVPPEMAAASHLPPALLAATFAVGRLFGHLLETAVYFGAWRTRGITVRFLPMLSGIVTLSLIDLATMSLLPAAGPAPAWATWIAGPRLNPSLAAALGPGLGAAFGTFGLAALVRVIGTAHVQRDVARVSWGAAWLVTAAVWLGSRLAQWWILDLARGRSPLSP